MALSYYYSAEVEDDAEQLARQRHERQLHRATPVPSAKDIEQDGRIRTLEHENQTLKCYVAGLMELMLRQGLIQQCDVDSVISEAAKVATVLRADRKHSATEQ